MTVIDRSEDGLVLESMPDGTYAWLRPEDYMGLTVVPDGGARYSAASTPSIEAPSLPAPAPVELPTKEASPADLLRDHTRFLKWLQQQPADVYVGQREHSQYCPIANFLKDAGFRTVYVNARITWDGGKCEYPKWAGRFVNLVDHSAYRDVRASHARALVHQAVRETNGASD